MLPSGTRLINDFGMTAIVRGNKIIDQTGRVHLLTEYTLQYWKPVDKN